MGEPQRDIDQSQIIDERRPAVPVLSAIIALSMMVDLVLLAYLGAGVSWATIMIVVSLGGSAALDLVTAWSGIYEREGKAALLLFVICHTLAVALFLMSQSPETAEGGFFGTFFLVGFLTWLERSTLTARGPLRVFHGLRKSGDLETGVVVAVVPSDVIDSFGVDFVEDEIREELVGVAEAEYDELQTLTTIDKEKTDLGFNITKVNETRVLHRVAGNLAEVLFVPEDGIVSRFEAAGNLATRLRFRLNRRMGFGPAGTDRSKEAHEDLKKVYAKFARPTVQLRETWRIRKRAIIASVFAAGFVVATGAVIFNVQVIIDFLSSSRVSTALTSLAALVSTMVVVVAGAYWLWIHARRKSS